MPAPTGANCNVRSKIEAWKPRRRSANAAVRPAIPAPTMLICCTVVLSLRQKHRKCLANPRAHFFLL